VASCMVMIGSRRVSTMQLSGHLTSSSLFLAVGVYKVRDV
jgi:hypothetical protein